MAKITKLEIRNYRGIREQSITVAPAGAVISGRNASGKTSVLRAIGAALAAQDLGPDAIRLGEDSAEIIVNLDALRVRRSITAKGTTLTVKNEAGDNWGKPQTRLNEMFGTCGLDPLDFYLADPKERKRQVLEAMPVSVTEEDLLRWGAPCPVDLSGNGLEVLERVRKVFYDRRTEVNRTAKAARQDAEAARAAALAAPIDPTAPDEVQARSGAEKAAAELRDIEARHQAAARARQATERSRERATALRARAAQVRQEAGPAPTGEEVRMALARVAAAEAALAAVQAELATAKAESKGLTDRAKKIDTNEAYAVSYEAEAAEIEASIAEVAAMEVTPAELEAAGTRVEAARAALARAEAALAAKAKHEQADALKYTAAAQELLARDLDTIVETLTTTAPAELAARSEMIPGLSFGDAGIMLDGVAVDRLSGAEQMRFAIDLARRANARAKILVVDGLERLDPERFEAFVAYSTRDDWQLLATRVAAGELVVEAIEPSDASREAAE